MLQSARCRKTLVRRSTPQTRTYLCSVCLFFVVCSVLCAIQSTETVNGFWKWKFLLQWQKPYQKPNWCLIESPNQRNSFGTTVAIFRSHVGNLEPKITPLLFCLSKYSLKHNFRTLSKRTPHVPQLYVVHMLHHSSYQGIYVPRGFPPQSSVL